MIKDFLFLSPEIFVFCLGLIILMADLIFSVSSKRKLLDIALFGLLLSLLIVIIYSGTTTSLFNNSIRLDPFSTYFKIIVIVCSIFVLLLSKDFKILPDSKIGEYSVLIVFATLGMMFMVMSNELLMIYLSIEFVSITFYILVGFLRQDLKSREASLKYFLLGAFSSAIFIYGASLLVGITQSSNLFAIQNWVKTNGINPLFLTSLLLMLVGFGFKIALVPFHMWAPDAYEGAPTPVTAFLSVASKSAGLAILIRTFMVVLGGNSNINLILAVLSAVTMTVGNLIAISQNNVKRLLAYSGIAHIGYILIGFVSYSLLGLQAILIYTLAYLFMNIGAFALVIAIYNKIGSDDIRDYAGMSLKNPILSLIFVLFLLSLAGIPPTAGFLGKFFVFYSAIDSGYVWLAIVGILNSVIALYYYFRIVRQIYFTQPKVEFDVRVSLSLTITIGISAVMVLIICIFPEFFIRFAKESAMYFSGVF
ncbi:MAG: NADH-quinone oxidoreductase subunit N [Candidatus Firestonebacteria bacterium]